ncbi:bifunctional biotin--[acetyl-CoA-carboxylase] synthetase/biotin operon repressor [Methylophaga lonarensis MPL]|uniref:Bifunctional biotin--[acetyl-CoA-carboxylase] synthetase/biotin operon repressor n=1 Tax=Methylophaga lonarensis MPL TaxID=1286106 RepID=M7P0Q4_9GAMM|nr:biotin--[acetyl-CoA-carboxylase] ligase [Methylophaga lonarensis]EMR13061.1 bifunctional biotin--[acetyl-CoA-carboxylase] synthetase/biotin operon repressor [Methylophaga lonarensis MPL]
MSASARQTLSRIETLASVNSTNDHAWQLLTDGNKSPFVCLAEQQTSGRGRRGKQWQSPAMGNLYLSLFWPFAANCPPRGLSIAIGVTLVETLNTFGINNLQLKWPNDVLCKGHKLAGILIESRYNGGYNTVIGVGLNFRLSPDLQQIVDQPVTSLEQQCSQLPCRNQLAGQLIENLIEAVEKFQCNGLNDFLQSWHSMDLLFGHPVEISNDAETFSAIAQGINANGELQYLYKGQLMSLSSSHYSIRLSL